MDLLRFTKDARLRQGLLGVNQKALQSLEKLFRPLVTRVRKAVKPDRQCAVDADPKGKLVTDTVGEAGLYFVVPQSLSGLRCSRGFIQPEDAATLPSSVDLGVAAYSLRQGKHYDAPNKSRFSC